MHFHDLLSIDDPYDNLRLENSKYLYYFSPISIDIFHYKYSQSQSRNIVCCVMNKHREYSVVLKMFLSKLIILCICIVLGSEAACPNAYFLAKHFDAHLPDDLASARELTMRSDVYRNYSGRGPAPRHTVFLTNRNTLPFALVNRRCVMQVPATKYECGPSIIRGGADWTCERMGETRPQHDPRSGHYHIGDDL